MQNAQWLSHPIWIVTHALYDVSRTAGRADGNRAWSSMTAASKISVTGPAVPATDSSSAARCTLWVPITTSTWAARRRTSSRSFWARHPDTTIWRPSRRPFQVLRCPRLPYSLLSAFSRMQHVLSTTTSASSRSPAATSPSASSSPAMRSESCSFIWHPNVRTT